MINDLEENGHKFSKISRGTDLIGKVASCARFSCSSLGMNSHLKTRFQSNPPRRSEEAPTYWNVSRLITSMMGLTTRAGSSWTRARSGSSHSALHSQWLSRKVNTSAVATSAPYTLDLMSPGTKKNKKKKKRWCTQNFQTSNAIISPLPCHNYFDRMNERNIWKRSKWKWEEKRIAKEETKNVAVFGWQSRSQLIQSRIKGQIRLENSCKNSTQTTKIRRWREETEKIKKSIPIVERIEIMRRIVWRWMNEKSHLPASCSGWLWPSV